MITEKPATWFWIVAALALAWNLMGVGAYIADVTMTEQALAALPEAERNLRESTPGFVTGAYAIAVFAGLGAAIALLLRRKLSIVLFAVSLAAVAVQMGYVFLVMNAAAVLGSESMTFPGIVILLGAFQLWVALAAKQSGWLR